MQPTKGCLTECERTQIKKWWELTRGIKAKRCRTDGCEIRLGVHFQNVFCSASAFFPPRVGQNITAFCEHEKLSKSAVVLYGYKYSSSITFCADAGMPICCAFQADIFWRCLQCGTSFHLVSLQHVFCMFSF